MPRGTTALFAWKAQPSPETLPGLRQRSTERSSLLEITAWPATPLTAALQLPSRRTDRLCKSSDGEGSSMRILIRVAFLLFALPQMAVAGRYEMQSNFWVNLHQRLLYT